MISTHWTFAIHFILLQTNYIDNRHFVKRHNKKVAISKKFTNGNFSSGGMVMQLKNDILQANIKQNGMYSKRTENG